MVENNKEKDCDGLDSLQKHMPPPPSGNSPIPAKRCVALTKLV